MENVALSLIGAAIAVVYWFLPKKKAADEANEEIAREKREATLISEVETWRGKFQEQTRLTENLHREYNDTRGSWKAERAEWEKRHAALKAEYAKKWDDEKTRFDEERMQNRSELEEVKAELYALKYGDDPQVIDERLQLERELKEIRAENAEMKQVIERGAQEKIRRAQQAESDRMHKELVAHMMQATSRW